MNKEKKARRLTGEQAGRQKGRKPFVHTQNFASQQNPRNIETINNIKPFQTTINNIKLRMAKPLNYRNFKQLL